MPRLTHVTVFIHLVWATWDRLPLITPTIENAVYRAIGAKCRELGAEVAAIGGIEDHVHLLVRLPATLTIADLVGQVKGVSAHLVTHKLTSNTEFFKWQGAYGAFSVSLHDVQTICDYIAHQREHHNANTPISAWELSDSES